MVNASDPRPGIRLDPPRMEREFRLMAWCASSSAVGGPRGPAPVASDLDWPLLARLGRRHRISGLLYAGLRSAGLTPPADVLAQLEAEAKRIAIDELWSAAETLRLQRILREGGVESLVLKGVAVAMLAFGRLGLRFNRDIDLLVRPEDVVESLRILGAQGYRKSELTDQGLEEPSPGWLELHKDIALQHESGRGIVELHWRLFDNPGLLAGSPPSAPVRIAGDGVVQTLGGDVNLIYLCVHGAEHAWSRLKWLLDIHALATRLTHEDLVRLYAKAGEMKVRRAVAQALLLCSLLFGLPIPEVIASSRRELRIRLLEMLALRSILASGDRELAATRFGSTLMNMSHYLLSDGWSYWKAELAYDVADVSRAPPPPLLRRLGPVGRLMGWAGLHLGSRG